MNPFVVGTPVLSPKRNYTLLVLPKGTDPSTIDSSLQGIPASNIISSPTSGKGFIIANRVYNAFPGYNRGGAAGPTKTPFPTVKAVNYKTGAGVDCSDQNLLPSPQPPTDMPTNALTSSPSAAAIKLTDGSMLPLGEQGSHTSAQGSTRRSRGRSTRRRSTRRRSSSHDRRSCRAPTSRRSRLRTTAPATWALRRARARSG